MGIVGLTGEQTLSLPREMQVLQRANRVLGTSHLGEQSFHGSSQGCRSPRVAYSEKQDRRPGFPRLCELLLKVYSGLLCQSSTSLRLNTLQTSLDIEWKETGSLRGSQNSGNYRSSVNVPLGLGALPD